MGWSEYLRLAITKGFISRELGQQLYRDYRQSDDQQAPDLVGLGMTTAEQDLTLVQAERFSSPKEVDGYLVKEQLGQGGMGVFKAFQLSLERDVALKILLPKYALNNNLGRLAERAKRVAKINHPNVISCFDAGEDDGLLYMVMELMTKGDLKSHLREQKTLPLIESLRLIHQCCLGPGIHQAASFIVTSNRQTYLWQTKQR